MAKKRSKSAAPAETGETGSAQNPGPDAGQPAAHPYRPPPQLAGTTQRNFLAGAPHEYHRPNVAMRVLGDPVARTSFSQVYSGQPRDWRR